MEHLIVRSDVPGRPETIAAACSRGAALARSLPAWLGVRFVRVPERLVAGSRVELRVGRGLLARRWMTERVTTTVSGTRDVQRDGPFASWEHVRSFTPAGDSGCRLEDRATYELPAGGAILGPVVRGRIERALLHQQRVLGDDADLWDRSRLPEGFRVLVTGASGLIGGEVVRLLRAGRCEVVRAVRRPAGVGEVRWDPASGLVNKEAIGPIDAVVHVAGVSLFTLWTPSTKRAIRSSRVDATATLARDLAALDPRPRVLVSASAIGYYGNRSEPLTEDSGPGTGFLADLCRDWEAATAAASDAGIRTVRLRTGLVLAARGGMLQVMRPVFAAGLGGWIGSGDERWSWVALEDVGGAIWHALATADLSGPINVTSPGEVSTAAFARTLAAALHRPAPMRVPAAAARLLPRDMAEDLLLASARVEPAALQRSGYVFRWPVLEPALAHILGTS